jgi:hypothetical protein
MAFIVWMPQGIVGAMRDLIVRDRPEAPGAETSRNP